MRKAFITCVIVCFIFSGCGFIKEFELWITGEDDEFSAQDLAWNGMDYYETGDYTRAIENFEKLKDWYPFSSYAKLAELKIGDAHYKLEQYEEAVFAYEEFEKLHPRNEAIPYVIYQIGRCYFDQIDTIDRDQNSARKALETFQRLKKQFPNDPYARSAEAHITTCYKSLAGNEYLIGKFYYKAKHYKAAHQRFMAVISKYPDAGYHQEALDYLARCEAILAKQKE
jgi:outer membrane protein assembly factor BamD